MVQSFVKGHLLDGYTAASISVSFPEFLIRLTSGYFQIMKNSINLLVIWIFGVSQAIILIHLTDVKRLAFINFNSIRSSAISSPKFI